MRSILFGYFMDSLSIAKICFIELSETYILDNLKIIICHISPTRYSNI
jgi:hypothetical protein